MGDYIDTPEMVPLQQKADRARRLVRGVISYSIQLVTVGDSRKPDAEKAVALAGYLEEVIPEVMATEETLIALTPAQIDTVLADVRRRIEDRYRDVRVADELLGRRQIQAVYNISYLPQIRLGVPGARNCARRASRSWPGRAPTSAWPRA